MNKTVEIYNIFELELENAETGKLVEYCGKFSNGGEVKTLPAFRCGNGRYLLRFMPCKTGVWHYEFEFAGQIYKGEFTCVSAKENNHGPVSANGYHFKYSDSSPYIPFGTTCYAWTHQTEELQKQTLETLKTTPFNKIRMCVFPKSMPYNNNDPQFYPFYKDSDGSWDIENPDERFWKNLEERISQLRELGIEADLILFHPYDRWGFSDLGREKDILYLEYCVARLAAYRNVWWSLANEYDFMIAKDDSDWDAFGTAVKKYDPYGHLISIHNGFAIYPKKKWMTHLSVQSNEINSIVIWRKEYGLPVIIDECGYEGDIEYTWGNLSAFEMANLFWLTATRGGYCSHGETFHREDEVLWWAKGGVLHGSSLPRLSFLKSILDSLPQPIEPVTQMANLNPNEDVKKEDEDHRNAFIRSLNSLGEKEKERNIARLLPNIVKGEDYCLQYFGRTCPGFSIQNLPENGKYNVEVLDIWEMTRVVVEEEAKGEINVKLPAKEGMGILVTRISGNAL